MAKSKDSKKNVKKAPTKTAKEKKAEKRLKKSKQVLQNSETTKNTQGILCHGLQMSAYTSCNQR